LYPARIHITCRHQKTSSGDLRSRNDVETAKSVLGDDPFDFRQGLKDDAALSEIRKRRKGKGGKNLERFHRKQNAVRHTFLDRC
jgi:hypothetical protein